MGKRKEKKPTHAEIKAKKSALSRTAAAAARSFLCERGAARGEALGEAAPLVFQGMCRREGIKVFFTDTPKTDGRSIWLGPVDLTNPLASVYVYGHGCHERHHVVHTDFSLIKKLESRPLAEIVNVFEDIRIDKKGAEDYPGYLLWRRALFEAYRSTGTAKWLKPASLAPAALLLLTVLFRLEVSVLGLEEVSKDALRLESECRRKFGGECCDALFGIADGADAMISTADAVKMAREVLSLLGQYGDKAIEAFESFGSDFTLAQAEAPFGQGSLFDGDGEVRADAVPRIVRPGFSAARVRAESFASLVTEANWNGASEPETGLREVMTPDGSFGSDVAAGFSSKGFAEKSDYLSHIFCARPDTAKRFYETWNRSGSLKNLFLTALEHPVPEPLVRSRTGTDLDCDALSLLAAGETALFRRPVRRRGRETAVEILLDTSGSMDGRQMAVAKTAGLRLLEAFRNAKGFSAAMGLFPGATQRSVTPVADWTSSVADTGARLDFVEGFGATPILQALFWAAAELDARSEEKKAIFVVTDGYFKDSRLDRMLDSIARRGIEVVMVGIGSESTPAGSVTAKVSDIEELPAAMAEVIAQMSRRLRLA